MANVELTTSKGEREDGDVFILSSTFPDPDMKTRAGSQSQPQLHLELKNTEVPEVNCTNGGNLEGCKNLTESVELDGTEQGSGNDVLETKILGDTEIKIVPENLEEVASVIILSSSNKLPSGAKPGSTKVIEPEDNTALGHVALSSSDKMTQTTHTISNCGPDSNSRSSIKLALDIINSTSFAFNGDGSDPTIYPTEDLHGYCLCCYVFPSKPYEPLSWPPRHAVNFELVLAFRKSFLALMLTEYVSSKSSTDDNINNPYKVVPTPTHIGHGRCFCCYSETQVHLSGMMWPPSHYPLQMNTVVSNVKSTDGQRRSIEIEGGTDFYVDSNQNSFSFSSSSSNGDGMARRDEYEIDSTQTKLDTLVGKSNGPSCDLNKSFSVGQHEQPVDLTDSELLNDATLSRVFAISPEVLSCNNPSPASICIPSPDPSASLDCSLDTRGMAKFSALNPGNASARGTHCPKVSNIISGVSGRHSKKDWSLSSRKSVQQNDALESTVGTTKGQRTIQPVMLSTSLSDKSKTGNGVIVTSVRATSMVNSNPSTSTSTNRSKRGRFEIFGNVRFNANGSLRDLYCDLCGTFCSTGSSFKRHLSGSHLPTSLRSSFKIKTPTERVHPFMCPVSKCKYTNQSTAERRSHLLAHHNCYLTGRRYNEFTGLIENHESSGDDYQVGKKKK